MSIKLGPRALTVAHKIILGRTPALVRRFTSCGRCFQQYSEATNTALQEEADESAALFGSRSRERELHDRRQLRSSSFRSAHNRRNGPPQKSKNPNITEIIETTPVPRTGGVDLLVDGNNCTFSPILLRDLCFCPSCLDPSTKQKSFSTADIPSNIRARTVVSSGDSTSITWDQDVPGFGPDHTTVLDAPVLRDMMRSGSGPTAGLSYSPGPQTLWDANAYSQLADIEYEAYMQHDAVLFKALQQLHTYGLMFLKGVPETERSVSTIAERIGPVKNTFYGYTWDVRSVPKAKNVAYTSQDLGFHMDLLYMEQPPHLQFLHCIRSSSAGGASTFTDSHKAASDLFTVDPSAFGVLTSFDVNFHYNHPNFDLYLQSRPVIQLKPLLFGGFRFDSYKRFMRAWHGRNNGLSEQKLYAARQAGKVDIMDYLDSVAWSPPFQAPFSLDTAPRGQYSDPSIHPSALSSKIDRWHVAASQFSALLHRPEGIYERLMQPGECVIFDNRRVLHARKAFEVGDEGKERWLRGAYLDKDPLMSKMRVLGKRFWDVEKMG